MSQIKLHVNTIGKGLDVVMLHGWGVNSAVFTALPNLLPQYRFHFVDLPGFGDSDVVAGDINDWLARIVASVPTPAIWIGWSLGGLVATLAALKYPQYVSALCTIASSPCFMARDNEAWPGIPPNILAQFGSQLTQDLDKTIERFLAIQAMGSQTAKGDIKQLREWVLAKPKPHLSALTQGLEMLTSVDLRSELPLIKQPWLRIWGKLDGLVPRKVVKLMPNLSNSEDIVLPKASHAPFISHTNDVVNSLNDWIEKQSLA